MVSIESLVFTSTRVKLVLILTSQFFVGMDIADQAQIFSTVNLEQTKVNRSLAYDLFALAHSRSPQKTCHNIAVALDRDTIGPLFKRIKCLGVASKDEYGIPLPGREGETITQARFVESLIVYLTSDRKLDRDRLLRGESLLPADDDELKIRPFRNLFVSGEEGDFAIADIVEIFLMLCEKGGLRRGLTQGGEGSCCAGPTDLLL